MVHAVFAYAVMHARAIALDHPSTPVATHFRCRPVPRVQLGSTAVGIQTKEGVILAVEKRITSPLLVRGRDWPVRVRGRDRPVLARGRDRPLLASGRDRQSW